MKTIFKICFFLFSILAHAPLCFSQQEWNLNTCIDYAVRNDPGFRQQELNQEEYKVYLQQSKKAIYPSLSANASHRYSFGRSIDPFTNEYTTEQIQANNFSINSSVVIFQGFVKQNTIHQNLLKYRSYQSDSEIRKRTLSIEVANAYLSILMNEEMADALKVQKESTLQQISITESLIKSGHYPASALLEIKATLASDDYNLNLTENKLNSARLQLKQLMNLDMSAEIEIKKPELAIAADTANLLIMYSELIRAIDEFPELRRSRQNEEAALFGIKIAKAGRYPALSLDATIFTGYSSARNLYTYNTSYKRQISGYLTSNSNQTVTSIVPVSESISKPYRFKNQINDNISEIISFNLSIPLSSNGRTSASIALARINQKRQVYQLEQEKLDLQRSLQEAYQDANSALQKYKLMETQVRYLQEAFRQSGLKYMAGQANSSDFFISSSNLKRANSELIFSIYEYLFKWLVLEIYKGNVPDL